MKPVKFLAAAREDIRREKSYYRAVNRLKNGDCGRAHNNISLQQTPKPLCGLGSLRASRSGAAELKR